MTQTLVVRDPEPLYRPGPAEITDSQLTAFMRHCAEQTGLEFETQESFYRFSVEEYRRFWTLFLDWSGIVYEGLAEPACVGDEVESAQFFPNVRLNYVENLLRRDSWAADAPAVVARHADLATTRLSRRELTRQVVAAARALAERGLGVGDRVVAISANNEHLIVAGLAVMALGATLSSASPDMGAPTVLARFQQLSPSILMVGLDDAPVVAEERAERLREIVAGLGSLTAVVDLDGRTVTEPIAVPLVSLAELTASAATVDEVDGFAWPRLPFNQPLVILFSSGTTGPPKCIVHTAGGVLLEHVKEHVLHGDLRATDVLYFHTSPAWMMWNWQLSALFTGAAIVLYSGPVSDPAALWSIVDGERATVFGTGPAYLDFCEAAGFSPRAHYPLTALRLVMSTGAILYDRQFDWIAAEVAAVPVHSISGGTDIVGCFVLGNPNLAVVRGESQCRSLGLDVRALTDPPGLPVGELVCANPFPSRPLGLYGDRDGSRFHQAYFAANAGVWTHGDLLEITPRGSARMFGRSDGILNIGGVRIGPAEIYTILNEIPGVREVLAVEQSSPDAIAKARLVLLVVTSGPGTLDAAMQHLIRTTLARRASPAHVPAVIVEVSELPKTFSGKGSERAVRDALNGVPSANVLALRNPESLPEIIRAVAEADEQQTLVLASAEPSDGDLVGTLCSIFTEVLRVPPVTRDDNFFDLGGTSLSIAYVCQAIHQRLGYETPLSAIFAAPTPSRLAEFLRNAEVDVPDTVVLLKPGAPGARPVFVAHGWEGDVMEYLQLARLLSGPRPVYGVRARGVDGRMDTDQTLEEMARSAIEGIRLMQATGPYTLLGFSFGGMVAFEIGRGLVAAGDEVDLLVLVDTLVNYKSLAGRERLAFLLREAPVAVARVIAAQPRDLLRDIVQIGRDKLRHLAPWLGGPPVPAVGHNGPGLAEYRTPRQEAFAALALRELGRFRAKPLRGNVVFCRSEERNWYWCEPAPVFKKVVEGRFDVIPVPGQHSDLVLMPNVQVLAERITPFLGG